MARQIGSGQIGDGESEHNIIALSELKWTIISNFNSDDRIYYCGQESLRRNEVALLVNKRVQKAVLGRNLKNNNDLCSFPGKPLSITVIQDYVPTTNAEEPEVERFYEDLTIQYHSNPSPQPLVPKKLNLNGSMQTYKT